MEITKEQAAEAVKLFGQYPDFVDLIHDIYNIAYAYYDRYGDMYRNEGSHFYNKCLLGCAWNAGRVQGIRDERARRNRTNKDGDKV